MKNFYDILNFLSEDSATIISKLRQKNVYIRDWIKVFVEEIPIIEATVKWNELKDYYPKWSNDLFEFAGKVCQECPHYNKSECNNSEEKKKCIADYNNLIELQIGKLNQANDVTLKKIKEKLVNQLNGAEEYVDNIKTDYSSEIDSGKYDIKKIRTGLNDLYQSVSRQQEEKENKEKSTSKKIDSKSENIILRDMKKYIHCFKLLKIETDRTVKYYEEDFNEIIKNIVEHDSRMCYYKIQQPAIAYISLYYMFFWDFLNNMKLRDAPTAFIVESKIDERQLWIAENNVIQLPKDKTPEEVEKETNETELTSFDPSYKKKYPYFFEHEQITFAQVMDFAERLKKLVNYTKLDSISIENFPNDIKNMFDKLVKKKKMLRSFIKADGKGNVGINSTDTDKLKKWFNYKIYEQFFSFIIAILSTSLRNKLPSIPKKKILKICEMIKQQAETEKNINKISLNKIVGDINKARNVGESNIKYTTLTDTLRNRIKDHPNFDKAKNKEREYKKIIAKSSASKNREWVNIMFNVEI